MEYYAIFDNKEGLVGLVGDIEASPVPGWKATRAKFSSSMAEGSHEGIQLPPSSNDALVKNLEVNPFATQEKVVYRQWKIDTTFAAEVSLVVIIMMILIFVIIQRLCFTHPSKHKDA
mmetsp:Transcript_1851/g.2507  ORF Transcript_1851/g.2507 Transcript_1851/m.2507 type:complete len:117 (+) Transcript_1851:1170-1520(+)|eukprot:CAMPEP_0170481470 /NCGR_PEP_ID=MMETSP0208-20121228/1904_1 /TAXON_ID=197538 /ORGANISM="Strombidium inclinatum, Strain S3" /LENGTH=116 /DNA_ID=CAMNT_0010754179 /DNA_START=1167 /DNA_END=1517 /DNA_ORIENTATION=-